MASRRLLVSSWFRYSQLGYSLVPTRQINGMDSSWIRQWEREHIIENFYEDGAVSRAVQIHPLGLVQYRANSQVQITSRHCHLFLRAREVHTSVVRGGDKVSKDTEDTPKEHGSVLMEVLEQKKEPKALTVGAKVVQAGQDFTYIVAILIGFGLVGYLFYSVGSEFFSSSSPSTIFSQALKRVKADERLLLEAADGQEYARGAHYWPRGGDRERTKKTFDNDSGAYQVRFLFVELVGHPPGTIIIEDNR